MFKAKKAEDLKNKIQIHIAKLNAIIREKKNFRASQVSSFRNRYIAKSPDLTVQFENVIKADICIEKATEALNHMHTLFRNTELLVDSKKLPEDIKFALEYCYYFSQVDKQKDLYNLLNDIIKIHKSKKHSRITHETKVFFQSEQVTLEDAAKYYPAIKNECALQEDQYLINALKKYDNIFQTSEPQAIPQFMQLNGTQLMPGLAQNPQLITQNTFQSPQFITQDLTQAPQFTNQNLAQPPQFTTQTLPQVPQFTPQNLGQAPQLIPQNLGQAPQLTPQNLGQAPQFTNQNSIQPPQFTPQDLGQAPQFTPQSMSQSPQFTPQSMGQVPQFIPQNLNQPPIFTPQNPKQPPN